MGCISLPLVAAGYQNAHWQKGAQASQIETVEAREGAC